MAGYRKWRGGVSVNWQFAAAAPPWSGPDTEANRTHERPASSGGSARGEWGIPTGDRPAEDEPLMTERGRMPTSDDIEHRPLPGAGQTGLGSLADDLAAAALFLARRFAAGATLWCWSPRWPAHAHHVAVEFVHPVVVGARALPAIVVDDPDPVAALRAVVAAGDVLVAVAAGDDPVVSEVMRRAQAWGLATIWVGGGASPPAGAADHRLWVHDDDDATTPHRGSFVLAYHLLWELTHVCFDHPGLLTGDGASGAAGGAEPSTSCATCSDEGRLGEVVVATGDDVARVRMASGTEAVDVTFVAPVTTGDLVLVHAGSAISRVEVASS